MASKKCLLHGVRFAFADGWNRSTLESMKETVELCDKLQAMGGIFCAPDDSPLLVFHLSPMFQPMPADFLTGKKLEQKRVVLDEEEELHVMKDWLMNVLLKHERGLLPPFKTMHDMNETYSDLACDYSPRRLRWAQTVLHHAYVRGLEEAMNGEVSARPVKRSSSSQEAARPVKRAASEETAAGPNKKKKRAPQTGVPASMPKEIVAEMIACYGRYIERQPLPDDGPDTTIPGGPDRLYKFYQASETLRKYWKALPNEFPLPSTFVKRYNREIRQRYESARGIVHCESQESVPTTQAESNTQGEEEEEEEEEEVPIPNPEDLFDLCL
jgi:hypothetical protein